MRHLALLIAVLASALVACRPRPSAWERQMHAQWIAGEQRRIEQMHLSPWGLQDGLNWYKLFIHNHPPPHEDDTAQLLQAFLARRERIINAAARHLRGEIKLAVFPQQIDGLFERYFGVPSDAQHAEYRALTEAAAARKAEMGETAKPYWERPRPAGFRARADEPPLPALGPPVTLGPVTVRRRELGQVLFTGDAAPLHGRLDAQAYALGVTRALSDRARLGGAGCRGFDGDFVSAGQTNQRQVLAAVGGIQLSILEQPMSLSPDGTLLHAETTIQGLAAAKQANADGYHDGKAVLAAHRGECQAPPLRRFQINVVRMIRGSAKTGQQLDDEWCARARLQLADLDLEISYLPRATHLRRQRESLVNSIAGCPRR